jgi:hypothetical protein
MDTLWLAINKKVAARSGLIIIITTAFVLLSTSTTSNCRIIHAMMSLAMDTALA